MNTPQVIPGLSFAQYVAAPGINQSALKVLLEGTPADLQSYLQARRRSTRATNLGTTAHHLVLQPAEFARQVVLRPPEFRDYTTKAARAWREATEAAGLLICTPKEKADLEAMRASLRAHPVAGRLLQRGEAEVSLFAPDPATGLLLKARLDWLPHPSLVVDGPLPVVDLKTAEDVTMKGFTTAVRRHHYGFQGAFILHLAQLCGLNIGCVLLFAAQKTPPYTVEVYQLGQRLLEQAALAYRQTLEIFAECSRSGVWPGSSGQIQIIEIE